MRVGYDAGPLLDPPTGVGRYTRELADALEMRGIELKRYAVALGGRGDPAIKRRRFPARTMRSLWRRFDAPSIRGLTGAVDVVHGTNFVLPPLGDVPGVVTVHDLSFFRDDVFPGGEALRDLVPWSVDRAARVLVPTEVIAREVCERFGVEAERVVATFEGVAPVFFGATPLSDGALGRLGIPGRFIVAVGTIEPRKNLARLLDAWRRIRTELDGWTLVLAGPAGWGPRLPETPGVILTGWVGDETLPGLLAAADVFCYPSLYEGFGLPPLEAMAAGTPAVVGRYGTAQEVLGDAALLVTPTDVDALAEGLFQTATD
ncbi:MAG TPA: glycosyltransferase family 1 protein, partial [Actinomycetota bacterium]|nr:glycosyltransferase family 1 protein [Actinomycetota bacterium]